MKPFRNLLVGVDPSHGGELTAPNQQAVHSALWLARENAATVTFFTALPAAGLESCCTPRGQKASRAPEGSQPSGPLRATERTTSEPLSALVRQAKEDGLSAQAQTAVGRPETELLRQVRRGEHDLVLVGASRRTGLVADLFGTTSSRLLDECPCPVWLGVAGAAPAPRNILIADDIESSDAILKVGVSLPRTVRSMVHVLNVVDYPLDHHWASGDLDNLTVRYHTQVRETAEQALRARLAQLKVPRGDLRLHTVGRTGIPDVEILHFVREHSIDLVVLGRTPRNGLLDVLLGHTADRLLPEAPCSLLVVKTAP
jgi:nucleotide-binding universal stress UspA family protein